MDLVTPPAPVSFIPQPGGQPPALQPGAVINALVLQLLDQGQVRLAVANTVLDVVSQVPLTPGTTVRLAVEGTPTDLRLVVLGQGDTAGPQAAARPATVGGEIQVRDLRTAAPVSEAGPVPAEGKPQVATALSQAVRVAAARQDGLGPLLADAEAAENLDLLPEPVRQAVNRLLALRTPLRPELTGTDLKQAFARSGLLMEARLAAIAAAPTAAAPADPAPDVKAALNALRQALGFWLEAAGTAAKPGAAPGPGTAPNSGTPPNPGTAANPGTAPNPGAVPNPQQTASLPPGPGVAPDDAGPPPRAGAPAPPRAPTPSPGATRPGALEGRPEAASARVLERAAAPAGRTAADALFDPVPRQRLALPGPALSPAMPAPRPGMPVTGPAEIQIPNPQPAHTAPPPPYRGAPPAAQPAVAPSITLLSDPQAIGETLLAETEAALARQTLLQVASLPDRAETQAQRPEASGPRWNFEVPFATPHGTAIAQFEIARDGHAGPAEGAPRAWRVRFTFDVEPMGPVHAQISLTGARASVSLWAERAPSAARLRQHAAWLRDALKDADFEPGDVVVREGAPSAAHAAAGRFLDRAS